MSSPILGAQPEHQATNSIDEAIPMSAIVNPEDQAPAKTSVPYKVTPVFDAHTLPEGLKKAHRTAAGVWGIIRVLEGRLRYVTEDTSVEAILTVDQPGLVLPQQFHHVQAFGPVRMQVEFYDSKPNLHITER